MSHLAPAKPAGRRQRQAAIRRAHADLPDADTMLTNIEQVLNEAQTSTDTTLAEKQDQRDWYVIYSHLLKVRAAKHGISHAQAVGIFAALSPSTDIDRNLRLADTMMATGDCAHAYGEAITKARRILNGEAPYKVLGGRKVRSFYRNLMYPHTQGHVTVDRHAIAIAYGKTLTDAEAKILQRPGAYAIIAGCYRTIARDYDLLPHQVQSITWEHWRKHYAHGATTNIEEF